MRISEIELHEFAFELEGIGASQGRQVYQPDSTLRPPGFILTIRADDGTEGHYRGFMYTPPMVTQVKMAASSMLLGRDPLERESIWQDYWKAFRHTDHLGLGPIDIALWDLAGKHYGASIGELLGGYRDSIKAYASTMAPDEVEDGLSSPGRFADFARECLEEGYPGYKIHPYGDPDLDIELCRAVAEEVGDEMDLMLDPASNYRTYADTLRVGRVMDELDFYWYEDPMADIGQSMQMAQKLVNELETPILGLEHVRTGPFGTADHLAYEALDMVRADAHLGGGITGVMKIAHLTESFGLDVELHVGGAAHLQCISAIRNTNYFEHGLLHPQVDWMSAQGYKSNPEQLNDDGTVSVPEGPGLGVEIDWSFVEANLTEHTVVDEPGAIGVA